jgi:competence protein ComEA
MRALSPKWGIRKRGAVASLSLPADTRPAQKNPLKESTGGMNMKSVLTITAAALFPVLAWACPVDINTADADELQVLQGVGKAKAEAIVASREEGGRFPTPDSITRVRGIGESTYEKNKDCIVVTD